MSEATTYLELRDLRVSYGKVEALHGISVHVEQGEIVTILGANGAAAMVGDVKYRDVNGDGIINTEDKVMISEYGDRKSVV